MAVQQLATEIVYPESDGQPMAENTKQLEVIVYLYDNLCALFADREDVFVAADLLWYPVEGHPEIRTAPDVFVAFGRPKGHRGSYKQWEEDNTAPQVVFEILSPGNRYRPLLEKFRFYERYGVEEYYQYDPEFGILEGWLRRNGTLEPIEEMQDWVSPRLGTRFTLEKGELVLYRPDGERFIPYVELRQRMEWAEQRAQEAEQRAREAEQRAQRLAQRLRELGIDPEEG
ncbi:MAG: Uma2 family endonuclease [Armatimonadota bacterium]